ncbi:hypothetical protein [Actinomycetospora sp. CA-053990]|uniref:hypothetical protein n=1 Tax=Actinomycetospora sp. CA-053990 TaxID=3239891 RepID=UPI003D93A174
MTSEKYGQTSPHQTPPMVSDAVATWFDDVFRIYGEVVDSQRRLAVALVHASSPVLDVGERASEKAAAGAERLSATVQARRQDPGRTAAPRPVAPPPSGGSGEQEDGGELPASREDVAGDEGSREVSSGDEGSGDEEIADVTAAEAEAAGTEEAGTEEADAGAVVPTGAGEDVDADAIAPLDVDGSVDVDTPVQTDTGTAEAATPVATDAGTEGDGVDDDAGGDAGERDRTPRRSNGDDADSSARSRATGARKASGAPGRHGGRPRARRAGAGPRADPAVPSRPTAGAAPQCGTRKHERRPGHEGPAGVAAGQRVRRIRDLNP